jgi:hypothetical protein
MSAYLLTQIAFIGAFACLGVVAACAWLLSRRERALLLFSIHSFLCAILSGWIGGIASTTELDAMNLALHGRTITALLMVFTNVAIICHLTQVRARRYLQFVAVFVSAIIASDLLIRPAVGPATGIRVAQVAWGGAISMPELPPTSALLVMTYAVLLSVSLFGLYASWRLWRNDRIGGSLVGLASLGTPLGYLVGA